MKEVIFHFFPSVRFLGLSLKILFHKNKEIKRMLSKKMTFSLMSLITIIALSFSVSPAMAAPVDEHPVGLAHGALAEDHAHFSTTLSYDEAENVDGRQVDVTIEFGKVVSEAAVQGKIITVTVVLDDFSSKDYLVWIGGAAEEIAADATVAI